MNRDLETEIETDYLSRRIITRSIYEVICKRPRLTTSIPRSFMDPCMN